MRVWLTFFTLTFVAASPVSGETLINVERVGEAIKITATTSVAVAPHLAWKVLTDYDRLADFVPDMHSSRVVSGPGGPLKVEQKGETDFLGWSFPIEVVLELQEDPERVIAFKSVSGNVRSMEGVWRVVESDDGVTVQYSATMETGFWIPPLIGPAMIENDVRRKVDAVAREMTRRANLIEKQP
jgi:carbon monoxide dehydrogenase subunit G